MDPDMNKYDLEHVCTAHSKMSPDEWNTGLSRRLEALLHRRACRDGDQARRRHWAQDEQDRRRHDGFLLRRADRGRPPAAMRRRSPQGEDQPPARDADRQSADFLSRPGGRVRLGGRAMADRRVALSPDQEAHRRGSREQELCRRRDATGLDRRDGKRRVGQFLRRQDSGYVRRPEKADRRGLRESAAPQAPSDASLPKTTSCPLALSSASEACTDNSSH